VNIVLTGYRCSGKTTVGEILAGDLGRRFVDTDRVVEEKIGNSIQGYVSINGWGKFREVERQIVTDIASEDNLIIATGGGVVTEPENMTNLRKNGWVVWLQVDPETIRDRMDKDVHTVAARPSLSGEGSLNEIEEVLKERSELYAGSSDYCLSTDDVSPAEAAEAIGAAFGYQLSVIFAPE
jgi:shikimate kinase